MSQLPLKFGSIQKSLSTFVPHSGVAEAIESLERTLNDAKINQLLFRLIFIVGPAGSGKSHLMAAYQQKLEEQGISVCCFELSELKSRGQVGLFVSAVEEKRQKGGIVLVAGNKLPDVKGDLEPHVVSRLQGGLLANVSYPQEAELRSLLLVLLERHGFRLNEAELSRLLKHLPANPLAFEQIIGAIDELSLSENRRINRAMIIEVLRPNGVDLLDN